MGVGPSLIQVGRIESTKSIFRYHHRFGSDASLPVQISQIVAFQSAFIVTFNLFKL